MDDELIEKLRATEGGLDLIKTHISWVLLGKEFVFKIKKPVKFSFLDFSTLDKRKFVCQEEIRLNSRLAKGVYIGVVPVAMVGGAPRIGMNGETIDYAVKMRKLDQDTMMDRKLKADNLSEDEIRALARVIANFHKEADRIRGEYNSPKMIWKQISDLGNFRGVIEEACGFGMWVDGILSSSEDFVKRNKGLIESRMNEGFVRDCHGDLHTSNVFFQDGVLVVDCIEFNKDFRCIDVASDIGFMAMDLDYSGRKDLSAAFVNEYLEKSKDPGLENLLDFYKCYRANVRAKIAAIEWSQSRSEEARARIDRYILLASSYAKRL